MGFVQEFKAFAFKGNVVDLAVGVIIGAAFGKIVSSLVEDVITPLLLNPKSYAESSRRRKHCTIELERREIRKFLICSDQFPMYRNRIILAD